MSDVALVVVIALAAFVVFALLMEWAVRAYARHRQNRDRPEG